MRRTSVTISSSASAVENEPWKKPSAGMVRSPCFDRATISPSSARRTAGRSDAGSLWAIAPPTVPRLRTWTSPIPGSTSRIRPYSRAGDSRSSLYVVSAPIAMRPSGSRRTPLSSLSRPMSTSLSGLARRSFISGRRLIPPAITFVPGVPTRPRARQQLAVVAVDGPLPERLTDALGNAAVELAVDDHRVDLLADVVHRDVALELGLAGLLVDLDDRDVRPERPGAVRRVVVGRLVEIRLHPVGQAEAEVEGERDLLEGLPLLGRSLD